MKEQNSNIIEIMAGATTESDGKEGLVPAPIMSDTDKYLKGDGTWGDVGLSKKDEQDADGNKIANTYAKKSLCGDTVVSAGRKKIQKLELLVLLFDNK